MVCVIPSSAAPTGNAEEHSWRPGYWPLERLGFLKATKHTPAAATTATAYANHGVWGDFTTDMSCLPAAIAWPARHTIANAELNNGLILVMPSNYTLV